MVKNETLVSYFHPLHCLYSSFKHSLILIPYSFTTVSLILILDLHLPYPPPLADPCRLKMRHSKIRNSLFFFNPFAVSLKIDDPGGVDRGDQRAGDPHIHPYHTTHATLLRHATLMNG